MPVIRDNEGRAVDPHRFTLGEFEMFFDNSGPFETTVTHPDFGTFNTLNSNRIVGIAKLGQVNLATSSFITGIRMPVESLDVEYKATSQLPMNLSSLRWKGQVTQRGRRI